MQNQQKKSLPPFESLRSVPLVFLNIVFGLFCVFFVLFFLAGIIYLMCNSSEETGLETNAAVAFFIILLIGLLSVLSLFFYFKKRMFTSTIIDEKGIFYLNKFNGQIIKEIPWTSFAKREIITNAFEVPKYDIISSTPYKAIFDQFYWPIIVDKKRIMHNDAFGGKHIFSMFYANRSELIRSFLLGLAHFRPDITVDPSIFSSHYINSENYTINYRQRRLIAVIGLLFCILLIAVLYFLII